MKKITLLSFLLTFILACATNTKPIELYVSVDGISANDGSKEKPFSGINQAITKAKELKSNNSDSEIIIHVLPGNYYLSKAIEIQAALSGISIIGTDASEVHVKGSVVLASKWTKFNDNLFVTQVDETLDFDQLIINGNAQILARYPNYDENGHYWQGYAADAISKERVASWKHPKGAFFNALHKGRWGGF
ncbi:peptide-binding protein, partial [Algibacter sp.]|nr:peptide-binding protein [Algibacter sp.]